MNYQHKQLAQGRWQKMSFVEQMANVGSEVERSLHWKSKNNSNFSQKAFERALELLELTINSVKIHSHLKELTRVREALVDYFYGSNQFNSSAESWRKYFLPFLYAARKNC